MKILLSAVIGVFVVTAILQVGLASNAAPTQQSYPLVCRGGGSLVTGIAPGERNIGFTFVRETRPAIECSSMNRDMQGSEPGVPIELNVDLKVAPIGAVVVISGNAYTDDKHRQVKIIVQKPSGTPASTSLTADVAADGKFSVKFTDTTALGLY